MVLPITLTITGAAALINIWLMIRVGQVRSSEKISIGDGGNEKVIRRMRAHSNFIESAPFVLLLVAGIELALGSSLWLWIVGGVFLLGRVAHGIGMDNARFAKGRVVGTIITILVLLGLAIAAIAVPYFTVADMSSGPVPVMAG